MFGPTKMRILVAAIIVGYNLWRIGAFLVKEPKQSAESETPRPRRKRKKGTWTDVISAAPATGRGPPAG